MVVLRSGSLPLIKYGHLGKPSFEELWLLYLHHRPLSDWRAAVISKYPNSSYGDLKKKEKWETRLDKLPTNFLLKDYTSQLPYN